jgi:transposase
MIYVFDNAQVHLTGQVREYLEQRDITAITLPQYSPHLNPIEKVFNIVKQSIMKSNITNW